MISRIIEHELKPKVHIIDKNGVYPESVLRNLGKTGIYNLADPYTSLFDTIVNFAKVSKVCGTTGFCVWCQGALVWYLNHTSNQYLRDSILQDAIQAKVLGGTGLSNPLKAYARIEKNHLYASRTNGGYIINGTLPWVSNIEYGHIFGAIFNVKDKDHNVMGIIRCDSDKVVLKNNNKFCALDGSATKSVVLEEYFIDDNDILADPVEPFLIRISPGFMMLQVGIAKGIIDSCIEQIKRSNKLHSHINGYLHISAEELEIKYHMLCNEISRLSKTPYDIDNPVYMQEVLRVRLEFAKLCVEMASVSCLASGTKGYMYKSIPQRNLREAYFIAIVTPSIKHLYKELDDIRNGVGVMKRWKSVKNLGYYEI